MRVFQANRSFETLHVRVTTASKHSAIKLAALARATGIIAAHAGNRNWIEVRGTIAQTKRETIELALSTATQWLTLWEPDARRLRHVDLGVTKPAATQPSVPKRARTPLRVQVKPSAHTRLRRPER